MAILWYVHVLFYRFPIPGRMSSTLAEFLLFHEGVKQYLQQTAPVSGTNARSIAFATISH